MSGHGEVCRLLDSLKDYLEDLRESGVDGLPLAVAGAPAIPPGEKERESLDDIRADLGECLRCDLGRIRTNLVFGVGTDRARIVFVGEAPGRDEDLKGEPFVGEAGQILTRLIARMGLTRPEVYICNVLKCRPPQNRNPHADEIEKCSPFMLRQVKAIGPEVIVALGTFATHALLKTKEPISKLRGRFHDYHGIPLMPTFHPSFLLRNRGDTKVYWTVWEDMVQVLKLLKMPVPELKRQAAKS
jgi:uracil-DNA glycosylase family 4